MRLPGRVMPAMRFGFDEFEPQKLARVLVAIFHAPALGIGFGDLDGGGFFDEILGFGRERACDHAACDRPEEPIGIRYDYLRKRFTSVFAKIQCCPAHLINFPNSSEEPRDRFLALRCRSSIRAGTRRVFRLAILEWHYALLSGTRNLPAAYLWLRRARCRAYKSATSLSPPRAWINALSETRFDLNPAANRRTRLSLLLCLRSTSSEPAAIRIMRA